MGAEDTQPQAAGQNARLARLAPLVGTWRLRMTTSRLVEIVADGSAVCAWMDGGAFLGLRQQLAQGRGRGTTVIVGSAAERS